MAERIHITQVGERLKVAAISNHDGIRVSRHELLYPSASEAQIQRAVARVRRAVRANRAALAQEQLNI